MLSPPQGSRQRDGEPPSVLRLCSKKPVLILSNGMVLPLMSEFLENDTELEKIEK